MASAGGRNLYQYVLSPTGYVDPLGLAAQAAHTYGVGGRIEQVVATVTKNDIGKGTGTSVASRLQAKTMGCPKDHAGHGLGSQLGGLGGVGKVFPQNPHINTGAYNVKTAIAKAVNKGGNAHIRIDFIYEGTSTRPDKIVFTATVGAGNVSTI